MPTALSAVAPSAITALITSVCPQQRWLRWAEAARVGFSVLPHHCSCQDVPATGDWHPHSPAKSLLVGFCPKSISFYNPAPLAISSVAETAASYCSNVPLIIGCGAVHRSKALPRRVRSLREYRCAFVAVLSNTPLVLCCKVWPRGRLPVV